jgi:acyl carrier protein phosphodiesterase
MNYLAHAFLSNNNEEHLVGNFIADHLRGNQFGDYSAGIIEGIHLHRKIDTFTDAHPEFKKAKRYFYNGFEKYSGVLVDIYFDHLLAKNFSTYSAISLQDFSSKVYQVYTNHQHLLPLGSSRFLEYVIKNNIYVSYADPKGIETVLYHLSQRIKHGVQLDQSILLFRQHEKELRLAFTTFFKDILSFTRS